ncbi:NADH-quinone oxidoreductase subunit C, partial [Streptomyces sp. URMC 124]
GAAGDRPVRRTRTATDGSASQPEAAAAPRRASASRTEGAAAPRRARSAADGSASQTEAAAAPRRTRSASDGSASRPETAGRPAEPADKPRPRSSDAPWHHARPAFE